MISFSSNKQKKYQARMLHLIRNPVAIRIEEFEKILNAWGFALVSIRGSHFKFSRPHDLPISVPVHHNFVGKIYVKDMCKSLLFDL